MIYKLHNVPFRSHFCTRWNTAISSLDYYIYDSLLYTYVCTYIPRVLAHYITYIHGTVSTCTCTCIYHIDYDVCIMIAI